MRNIIILILIIALIIIFILPWWGAEEEPRQMQPLPIYTQNTSDNSDIYVGLLPCADCSGIKTTLKLFSDNRYELTENYGEKGTFASSGTWQILPKTQKINLIQDKQFYEITKEGHLYRLNDQAEYIPSQFDMTLKKQY